MSLAHIKESTLDGFPVKSAWVVVAVAGGDWHVSNFHASSTAS